MSITDFIARLRLTGLCGLAAFLAAIGTAGATTLYAFTGSPDAANPFAGVKDTAGNLYGTTANGGSSNQAICSGAGCGTVFKLTPSTSGSGWNKTVLYNFCMNANCSDGQTPQAALTMDAAGNLYGTTFQGGSNAHGAAFNNGSGIIFELSQPKSGVLWNETVLYNFTGGSNEACGFADGAQPLAGLIPDSSGSGVLYGTTASGGHNNLGTVFKLTPPTSGAVWTFCTLYDFAGGSDGAYPQAGLIWDNAGNLYGTTVGGGSNNAGTVFKLAPSTSSSGWSESVVHSFGIWSVNCSPSCDGNTPHAGLTLDTSGSGVLYGATSSGGNKNAGAVFELTPPKSGSVWTETVLYSFCSQSGCADGAYPNGLILDTAGNLYGTAANGGNANNAGTVFELTRPKSGSVWSETLLHTFCAQLSKGICTDGEVPLAGLTFGSTSSVRYGTTELGGGSSCPGIGGGCGVVFQY